MSIISKIGSVLAGFALVASFVAAPAQAQTTADLQAQIAALQAQLAALAGASTPATGGVCINSSLTVGSRGADVTTLQTALKAAGYYTYASITGYFGPITRDAVAKWQVAAGITPAVGYFGPISRAKLCGSGGTTGPGPVTPPPTGSALMVSKAATSPSNTALIQGQAIGDLAHFTFTNPTATAAKVTALAFDRIGVSNDSTLDSVYLFNGATRLSDGASVSSSRISFNDSTGLFTVPAGGSMTIAVKADIDSSSNGQIVGVSLVSVGTNVPVAAGLPISGNLLSIASATMATVDFNTTTTPSAATVDPQDGYTVWQNTTTVGTRAVNLKALGFEQIGSVDTSEVLNFKLFIDGVQVGSTVAMADAKDMVVFDLSSAPVKLNTGSRVIKVTADLVGGSGDTVQLSLRNAGDGTFVDSELMQPVLATANGSSFSARSSGALTIGTGIVTVTKKSNSPSGNITLDSTSSVLGSFEMKATGERVKVRELSVQALVNGSTTGSTATIRNSALYANGVQVGSTQTLGVGSATTFSLGSALILEPGTPVTLEVRGDVYDNTGTNEIIAGTTIQVRLNAGSSNGEQMVSRGNVNVPSSATSGNALTVATGGLSGAKVATYANQTTIDPKTAYKIGSFRVIANDTEGINLNTITVDIGGSGLATSTDLSDLYVMYGSKTSTVKSSVSTSNAWNINESLAANGEMQFDVYVNLNSSLGSGDTIIPSLTVEGVTANSAQSKSTGAVVGQTITISTSTISAAAVSDSSVQTRLLVGNTSGAQSPKVASFRFTSTNDNYTITDLAFKVSSTDAASAVSSITLKSAGAVDRTFSLTGSSSSIGTTSGLTLSVPANDSAGRIVDVYLNLGAIGPTAATTSANVMVTLDTYKALSSDGSETTTSTDVDGNAHYVYKTLPTITVGSLTSGESVLGAGTNKVLSRFTIAADAAGQVDWTKIIFTYATSTGITLANATIYKNGTEVAGTDTISTSGGTVTFVATSAEEIAAGSSATYELRGDIGGIQSSAYNYISVSIANPSSSKSAPNTYAVVAATSASFVWTDRSALSHSASTADWVNDYKVKNLPASLGTIAVTT